MPIKAIGKDPKGDYEKFLKILNTVTDLPGAVMSPVMRPVMEKLPPVLRTLLFGVDDPKTVQMSAGGILGGPLKMGILRNSGAPMLTKIGVMEAPAKGAKPITVNTRGISNTVRGDKMRILREMDTLSQREMHKAGLRKIPREKAVQSYKNLAAKTPRTGRNDDFGRYALEGNYVPSYFGTGPNVSARNYLQALRNTLYGSSIKTVQKLPNVISELLEGK